jgi:hypothetical protein
METTDYELGNFNIFILTFNMVHYHISHLHKVFSEQCPHLLSFERSGKNNREIRHVVRVFSYRVLGEQRRVFNKEHETQMK